MKAAGMASVSPSSPDLIALLEAGITLAELVDATKYAVEKQKPFSYALKTAEGRRRDAARITTLPAAVAATGETAYQRTQRERMQQWAPGVAARSPADANTTATVIDMEAHDVTARRLG
jgi:hypothetical protein